MLKIRDDVDLKELEKYGLQPIEIDGKIVAYTKSFKYPCYNSTDVYTCNRKISYFNRPNLDTIYNLVKADIVEQIDDEPYED